MISAFWLTKIEYIDYSYNGQRALQQFPNACLEPQALWPFQNDKVRSITLLKNLRDNNISRTPKVIFLPVCLIAIGINPEKSLMTVQTYVSITYPIVYYSCV